MERTRILKQNKNQSCQADGYFHAVTLASRIMRNTANFYIRNTMTGIKKSPEERTLNETEVLHYVFTGIQKANLGAMDRYRKILEEATHVSGHTRLLILKKAFDVVIFSYPTRQKWFLSYEKLNAIFCHTDNPHYRNMYSSLAQNAIKKACADWKDYFASLKKYKKDPSGYKARPNMPGYIKTETAEAWFTNQASRVFESGGRLYLTFCQCSAIFPVGKTSDFAGMKYLKTEVCPEYGEYVIHVTFQDKSIGKVCPPKKPKRLLGIDVGLTNLAAVANNFGAVPFLIRGGAVKSMNQWYNKRKAELTSAATRGKKTTHAVSTNATNALSRKRNDFIRDAFYKYAHRIIQYAVDNNVDAIIVGNNEDIKQEISLGRQNNQAFVSIPFYKFRQILAVVAAKAGIPVVAIEESYTSKASVVDRDKIPVYGKEPKNFSFSGARFQRGLYRTKDGHVLNADINGAANIIRKAYPHAFDDVKDFSYLWKTTVVLSPRVEQPFLPTQKQDKSRKTRKPGLAASLRRKSHMEKLTELRIAWKWTKAKPVGKKEKASDSTEAA